MRPGMDSVRGALVQGLNTIRADNNKKLDEIRGTVEENCRTRCSSSINDSFKTVSAQLEQVYKGLGEMQNLACRCGQLKAGAVRRQDRGILGECSSRDFRSRSWPPASTPATSPLCPAARTAWSTPSRCRGRTARSGCPSTRNSRAIPTRICRRRRSAAMLPLWPPCARR